MERSDRAADFVEKLERPFSEPGLFLGTSAFTAAGWPGTFYPEGMKSSDYLTQYASKFKTVEIDSTYYGTPSASTMTAWRQRTPPDFVLAAKVPQSITHEKILIDCEAEFGEFMSDNLMIALNHAVAVAMVHGPRKGLELLAALDSDTRLAERHRLEAVRAHLLEMAGDLDGAATHRAAAGRTGSLPIAHAPSYSGDRIYPKLVGSLDGALAEPDAWLK
jgi:hypothetical protein